MYVVCFDRFTVLTGYISFHSQIHCPPFYVCRTVHVDTVTGEEKKELIITIRGTLSVKVSKTHSIHMFVHAIHCPRACQEQ